MTTLEANSSVYGCWFSAGMSNRRAASVGQWRKAFGDNFILITGDNVEDFFESNGMTLHPGFKLLTANHKSDYVRSFLMFHLGGVYTDIKPLPYFFKPSLMRFWASGSYLGGYGERNQGGVSLYCSEETRQGWRNLLGNGHFVMRAGSDFAHEWNRRVLLTLDSYLDLLREFGRLDLPRGPIPGSPEFEGYPLRWAALQGEIFHEVQKDFGFPGFKCLPRPRMRSYL